MLDTMLWIAQGLLGVFFVAVGVPKVVGRGLDLWTGFDRLPRALVIVIGTCSIAGGIALVVPMLTGTLTWVTPLAAIGLSVLTLEASGFHVRGGEWLTAVETGIWAAIAAVIAAGRWGELASAPSVQVGILGPSLAVLLPTVLVILVLLTRRPVREARATQEPAAAAR